MRRCKKAPAQQVSIESNQSWLSKFVSKRLRRDQPTGFLSSWKLGPSKASPSRKVPLDGQRQDKVDLCFKPGNVHERLCNLCAERSIIVPMVVIVAMAIFGHIIAAMVVGESVEAIYILENLRKRLSSEQIPHEIKPVDSLPKTANGKIDRVALRRSISI